MVNPNFSSLPIGVFDSGFGGLTVVRALQALLPYESIVYLGDAARLPYGDKSADTIIRYSRESEKFLCDIGIKLLVIACHTASSFAFPFLKKSSSVPVIGMVEPCIEELCQNLPKGKIAILGTKALIASNVYQRALEAKFGKEGIIAISCPLFAPIIEEGMIDTTITKEAIKHYLSPLVQSPVDTILLACTHYPLIQKQIQDYLGGSAKCIDPGQICAKHVQQLLSSQGLLSCSKMVQEPIFFTTDDIDKFFLLGKKFLSKEITNVQKAII